MGGVDTMEEKSFAELKRVLEFASAKFNVISELSGYITRYYSKIKNLSLIEG